MMPRPHFGFSTAADKNLRAASVTFLRGFIGQSFALGPQKQLYE